MQPKYEKKPHGYKIDIPFSEEEKSRFISFTKNHGKSKGAWTRLAILRAMSAEEKALAEAVND